MLHLIQAAVGKVIGACKRANVISGSVALGPPNAKALAAQGMQLLTITADSGLIRRGAAADLTQAQACLGGAPAT